MARSHRRPVHLVPTAPGGLTPSRPRLSPPMGYAGLTLGSPEADGDLPRIPLLPLPASKPALQHSAERQQSRFALAAQPPGAGSGWPRPNFHALEGAAARGPTSDESSSIVTRSLPLATGSRGRARAVPPPCEPQTTTFSGSVLTARSRISTLSPPKAESPVCSTCR